MLSKLISYKIIDCGTKFSREKEYGIKRYFLGLPVGTWDYSENRFSHWSVRSSGNSWTRRGLVILKIDLIKILKEK